MKKVYVVTSGSYSDYGIDAIFDSRELAQAFINSFKKGYMNEFNGIDEWEVNPAEADLKAHRKAFELRMNKEGEIQGGVEWSDSAYNYKRGVDISFTMDGTWMNVYCFADDEQHAIKIANEKRAQYLALNRWGKNS